MTGSRQPYVKLASLFWTVLGSRVELQLVFLTLNRSSTIFQSFLDWLLLGYVIFKLPLLATISSAVNGLRVNLHLESDHHFFTSATSCWNCASSASACDIMCKFQVLSNDV
jgi:hypothetical protein